MSSPFNGPVLEASPSPSAAFPDADPPRAISPSAGRFLQRRCADPLLTLLRTGVTPRRLAWSLALGAVIGVNPIIGSTTLVCLGLAALFRLNLVASQLVNHLVFPAQLALVFAFLRAGEWLFHTGPLPLARHQLLHALGEHAWQTTRLLWTWEWHALVVWLTLALLLAPLLALALTPVLARLLFALQHQPIVEK